MLDLRIIKDGEQFTPEALATAIGSAQAVSEIGAAIEHMIGLLDAMQGDPDLEATADEDWPDGAQPCDLGPGCSISDHGEDNDPLEEDDSLTDAAWIERIDQGRAPLPRMRAEQREDYGTGEAIGNAEDLEDDDDDAEHDGGEPDHEGERGADDEPACGSIEGRIDQCGWGNPGTMPDARPAYGEDQSGGPTNIKAAAFEHQTRELGLVRTEAGWRRP